MNNYNKHIKIFGEYFFKVFYIVGAITLLYIFFIFGREYYHFRNFEQHTYGVIDSVSVDWYNEKTFHYSFSLNNKTYNGTKVRFESNDLDPQQGEKFKVKYSSKNPDINRMIIK